MKLREKEKKNNTSIIKNRPLFSLFSLRLAPFDTTSSFRTPCVISNRVFFENYQARDTRDLEVFLSSRIYGSSSWFSSFGRLAFSSRRCVASRIYLLINLQTDHERGEIRITPGHTLDISARAAAFGERAETPFRWTLILSLRRATQIERGGGDGVRLRRGQFLPRR